jgi:hypothetical protein
MSFKQVYISTTLIPIPSTFLNYETYSLRRWIPKVSLPFTVVHLNLNQTKQSDPKQQRIKRIVIWADSTLYNILPRGCVWIKPFSIFSRFRANVCSCEREAILDGSSFGRGSSYLVWEGWSLGFNNAQDSLQAVAHYVGRGFKMFGYRRNRWICKPVIVMCFPVSAMNKSVWIF